MNAKEQAKELYQSFFSLIVDAVDERELDAQELSRKCAINTIDFVLSIDSSISYWHDVKEELNEYSNIPEEVNKEIIANWVEACHKALTSEKHTTAEEFNDEMNKIYEEFRNGE